MIGMNLLRFFEKHKYGILGTVLLHFFALSLMSILTIPNAPVENFSEIVMEFAQEPEPEKKELPKEIKQQQDGAASQSNKAVNKAAPKMLTKADYNKYDSKLDDDIRKSVEAEIREKLKAIEQDVISEQRNQGKGYSQEEAEALINSKKQQELETVPEVKAKSEGAVDGPTNITYRLENRYDTYIKVPVYLCQYGGEVTINIVVDRKGRVVNAKQDKESSKSTDKCLIDAALKGALNTRFNSSSKAPKLQRGAITFRFVAQ